MYYGLILLSVVMFSGCFVFSDIYRKIRGSAFKASIEFLLFSSVSGLIVLLFINKFRFEFTPFTMIIAVLSALNGVGFTFCSFKALDKINLSLYSLFSMLGGMLLPFIQGIIFYHEDVTLAKCVCIIFVCVSLLLTIEKGGNKKGTVYYIGIFILNGMSGVLSKIFADAPYAKTSAAGYSILSAMSVVVISVLILLLFCRNQQISQLNLKGLAVSVGNGVMNQVANYILVIALMYVDASVQYPMVTGGVIVTSTVICFFNGSKPTKKQIVEIAFAFFGMLSLFIIPV